MNVECKLPIAGELAGGRGCAMPCSCHGWLPADPQWTLVSEGMKLHLCAGGWSGYWCPHTPGCPLDGKLSSDLDCTQRLWLGDALVWNSLLEIQFHPVHTESSEQLQGFWKCQPARADLSSFPGRWRAWLYRLSAPTTGLSEHGDSLLPDGRRGRS